MRKLERRSVSSCRSSVEREKLLHVVPVMASDDGAYCTLNLQTQLYNLSGTHLKVNNSSIHTNVVVNNAEQDTGRQSPRQEATQRGSLRDTSLAVGVPVTPRWHGAGAALGAYDRLTTGGGGETLQVYHGQSQQPAPA